MVSSILDGIKSLFVPSDKYFEDKIGTLQKTLESKVGVEGYKQMLESLDNASGGNLSDIKITLGGKKYTIIDFDFLAQYKGFINGIAYAIFGVLILRYNINNVHRVISGNSMYGGGEDD